MKRVDYDVVVVGASTAGLHAAALLAAQGSRVTVLERKPDPAAPARSWIVTSHIERVLDTESVDGVVHRTGSMEMFAGRARQLVRLTPPDLVVERALLIPYLRQRAERAGAEVQISTGVDRIVATAGALRLDLSGPATTMGRMIRARHVVGADGVRSLVARAFGAGPQNAVPIVQAKVELPVGYDPDVTRVWFDRERTRFFYWLIPDSAATGVVGVVAEAASHARALLDEFLTQHGFRPLEYQGAMIPLHRPRRRIAWRSGGSRVLLVGDAAAHVKVTTVGGVVSGLWGATAATTALARGTSYRRELRAVHRELYLHDLIRWGLDRFEQADYERMLGLLNGRLSAYLGKQNRDSIAMAPLPLVFGRPRLWSLALKALLFPHRADPWVPITPGPLAVAGD